MMKNKFLQNNIKIGNNPNINPKNKFKLINNNIKPINLNLNNSPNLQTNENFNITKDRMDSPKRIIKKKII